MERYGRKRGLVNAALLLATLVAAMIPATGDAAAAIRLLVLGDSLTAGYGLPAAEAFPVRLEESLRAKGRDVTVINAGVSGDTTAGGLARLDWALADKPDAVIVELGANDGLRGVNPAATKANLDAIVEHVLARGLPVLVAGMRAPPNLGRAYAKEFNALFPDVAGRHGALLYPFFLEGVAAVPRLNQADGIHPNPEGVSIVVGNILPKVEELLGRVR